jgi:preprotein translocase subunit SecY
LFAVMIMLLTYAFLPNMGTAQAIAGSLARRGGEIPGVPPGAPTAAYIRQNLKWASVPVPFYMAIICLLPEVMNRLIGLPMMINGLNLFIVVFALNDVLHGVRQARSGSVTSDLATRQFDATK